MQHHALFLNKSVRKLSAWWMLLLSLPKSARERVYSHDWAESLSRSTRWGAGAVGKRLAMGFRSVQFRLRSQAVDLPFYASVFLKTRCFSDSHVASKSAASPSVRFSST